MSGGKGKIEPKDGKPFKKNDSRINRAGRPKKLPGLDDLLCEVFDVSAMRSILTALKKKAISGDCRASELLLDRCYGKLTTKNDISLDLSKYTDDELMQLIQRLTNTGSNEKS